MQAKVGYPHVPFRTDAQLMRLIEAILAPGANEAAVGAIHLDRVAPLIEDPNLAVVVDVDSRHPSERLHVLGALWPVRVDVVFDDRGNDGMTRIPSGTRERWRRSQYQERQQRGLQSRSAVNRHHHGSCSSMLHECKEGREQIVSPITPQNDRHVKTAARLLD